MTGEELKAIRKRLGLSTTELGRAFGYTGTDASASVTIRKYESRDTPVAPIAARLAMMFDRHGVPIEWQHPPSWDSIKLKEMADALGVVFEFASVGSYDERTVKISMWAPAGKEFASTRKQHHTREHTWSMAKGEKPNHQIEFDMLRNMIDDHQQGDDE